MAQSWFGSVERLGESQVLTISLFAIGDEYTPDHEPLSRECMSLLRSLLFDPVLEDGCFPASSIEQEKRCLTELIEAEQNDKRTYARNRCEQIMCESEGYGVNKYGTVQTVAALTATDVTAAWKHLLKTARVCLSFLGMESDGTLEEAFQAYGRTQPVSCRSPGNREGGNGQGSYRPAARQSGKAGDGFSARVRLSRTRR